MERFEKQGRIDYLNTNAGIPRKLNERTERLVLQKVKLNPKLSAPKIASNIADECKKHVNPETILRIIRRAGYNGRVAWRKPLINEQNRKICLQFAREHYLKQETWWRDVIFYDESKFNLFGPDGRTTVWRKPNEELKK